MLLIESAVINSYKQRFMKYLPTDVSTFSTMITGNYVYVDKTEHIYNLVKPGASRYYFLSRPRRFGKTLLISTLAELFSGNKELFKDLWIAQSDFEWSKHPIIHLDFSVIGHRTVAHLEESLNFHLSRIGKEYDIRLKSKLPEDNLYTLIMELSKINSVVLLVDEYDKPILDHLDNRKQATAQRNFLKSFYDVLKGMDAHMRAIFITGVSKFSKTSIFSGINNLNDISTKSISAQLLGYTKEEIVKYFEPYLTNFAQCKNIPRDTLIDKLQNWYNGYRFSECPDKVYNPFSVLYCLNDQLFRNYWFESGTPSFLISLLKTQFSSLENIENLEISSSSLGSFDLENIPLIPLLFQTGYLTFSDYDSETDKFKLGFPNHEVEDSFKKYLVATLASTSPVVVDTALSQLIRAITSNNIPDFCSTLKNLYAHVPYSLHGNKESYYHALFQFLLSLLSLEAQSEILTDVGRIDLVLTTKTHIYIFELKVGISAEVALQQIKDRKYYERYLDKGKEIMLVGLSFNPTPKKNDLTYISEKLG
jgi:hypothetical protein